MRGTKLSRSYWRRHIRGSLWDRPRRTLFEDCGEQHSERPTHEADYCRKASQDLRKPRIEVASKQTENRNYDGTEKKQHSALSQSFFSGRHFSRSSRFAKNRQHATVIQQLNDAFERETAPRTKPDGSRSLLLTAMRTIHS